jgi:uncharacterized protein YlbG (UPF0298 family)
MKRQSLLIYYRTPKILSVIKKLTNVVYYHKYKKYAIGYVDVDKIDEIKNELLKIKTIKHVELTKEDIEPYQINFDVK